ncbi:Lipopolysaccharide-induced tumor necrosis factor-alpha factor [Tetrabaena socialis]|uniref:Lipopolysaccharide-induced tumor necrosis factor-alpha factor n=1 Tax=Tetrabaena socialis TaxID=47790 RepID=A0A2J8A2L6_9CHLO|nr:Lipopolysaccharide-induced tumor necrosis factor-alpha factor [Tetrabaena socialis]|eukprot:PNH06760.1 Lipopolysaccharide-induced tumor necrosis factor-alpha factor [Tetrabaena socialis]
MVMQQQQQPGMIYGGQQMPPGTMMMMVPVQAPQGPPPLPVYWPPHPTTVHCPTCNTMVNTTTVKEPGLGTWMIAGGLCIVGCSFGCCLIPFCVDSLKDTMHMCPQCNRVLGMQKMV